MAVFGHAGGLSRGDFMITLMLRNTTYIETFGHKNKAFVEAQRDNKKKKHTAPCRSVRLEHMVGWRIKS